MDRPRRGVSICSFCTKGFTSQLMLDRHTKLYHSDELLKCGTCGEEFSDASLLKIHEGDHFLSLKCECGLKFDERHFYNTHIVTHMKKWDIECVDCGLPFKTHKALRSHLAEHSDVKYTCVDCNKVFNHSYGLIQHKGVHTGKKPYGCPICHEDFADPFIRNLHAAKAHLPWCRLCNLAFSDKKHYNVHYSEKHQKSFSCGNQSNIKASEAAKSSADDCEKEACDESGSKKEPTTCIRFNSNQMQYLYIPQELEDLPGKNFLLAVLTMGTPDIAGTHCFVVSSPLKDLGSLDNIQPSKLDSLRKIMDMFYTRTLQESKKSDTDCKGKSQSKPGEEESGSKSQFMCMTEGISSKEEDSLEANLSDKASAIVDPVPSFDFDVPDFDSGRFLYFLEELYDIRDKFKFPLDTNLAYKVRKTVAELMKYLMKFYKRAPDDVYLFYLKCYKDLSNDMGNHEKALKLNKS